MTDQREHSSVRSPSSPPPSARMRTKLIHYTEIFGSAFAVAAIFNADHLLQAHGLDALKSAAFALAVTAAKAGVDALKATVARP